MKKTVIIIISLLLLSEGKAQDPQFSQFYAFPMYLNPAFAGTNLKTRVNAIYRNQWSAIPGSYTTYGFSADQNLEEYNSGFGIMFMQDIAGSANLRRTEVSGLYSYKIQLNNDWVVRAGLQGTYLRPSINYDDLVFGSQLDPDQGYTGASSGENLRGADQVHLFDFSSGLLAYNEIFWFGTSLHHMNRPDLSFDQQSTSLLPVKFSVHGGAKIPIVRNKYTNYQSEVTMSPAFNYRSQGKFDQLDLGLYLNYDPVVLGVWYRGIPVFKQYDVGYSNHDAVTFLVGFHQDFLTIGYSYDLTVSQLGPSTGGSHEISVGYEFYYEKKRKKQYDKYVPCPRF